MLPTSIEAHHGLVDGFHIAKYLSEFKGNLIKNKHYRITTLTVAQLIF